MTKLTLKNLKIILRTLIWDSSEGLLVKINDKRVDLLLNNSNNSNNNVLGEQNIYNSNNFLFICLRYHNILNLFLENRRHGPTVKIIVFMKGCSMKIALFK